MRDECAGLSRRIKEEQEARASAEMEVPSPVYSTHLYQMMVYND